jgi:hypothetical protein
MSKDMEKGGVPSWMAAGAEKFSPTKAKSDEVPVLINLGEAFDRYIRMYYRRLQSAVDHKGGTLGFDVVAFRKYIYTLIDSRVKHVMRYAGAPRPIVHYNTEAAVPTLVEKALTSIGRVKLDKLGIIFVPAFEATPEELLTIQEFNELTLELQTVMANGFTYGDVAYDRKPEGAPDMMVMQYLHNGLADVQAPPFDRRTEPGVYSHAEYSPAFAPLAFLFGLRQMQSLLGARVFYADESAFEEHLINLAAA